MRKEEYLNRLAQELKQYDKAYAEEILRDYEEHFQDAAKQGKTEEETSRELGSPEEIGEQIKEMLREESTFQNLPARGFAEIEKAKEQKEEGQEGAWNSGSGADRKQERAETEIKKIRFSAGSADVRLLPSKDGILRVYPEEEEELEYMEYRYEGDTYYGRVRNRKGQLFNPAELLFGLFGKSVERVTLEIPRNIEEVTVETLSGDVEGGGIALKNLNLTTVSGDAELENMDCNGIFLSSKSGDIRLIKIRTETLLLETFSGDVQYKDLSAEVITCNSLSGDFGGKRLDSRDIYFKSVSGDACFHLTEKGRAVYVCRKSLSGEIMLKTGRMVSEQEFQCLGQDCIKIALTTVSGDIAVKGAKEKYPSH